ncbi:MAG: PLP-dependent aminotransferase family protein [Pseudomonadota bacterium]
MLAPPWMPDLEGLTGPKYRQLVTAIERAIDDGGLAAGQKLPPVRDLAWDLKVTPGTVARAYREATEAGLLEAHVGQGTFVRAERERGTTIPLHSLANPTEEGQIDLRNSRSPLVGQEDALNAALQKVIGEGSHILDDYTRAQNDLRARRAMQSWLASGGVEGHVDDIVLTYGSQNAILAGLLAVTRGSRPQIIVSELMYPGFQQAARVAGVELLTVGSDEYGILPGEIDALCLGQRPHAILLAANIHNPTLVTMSLDRRCEIAALARHHNLQIIEDDVYGWLEAERLPSFPELAPERTWYATSLSKCIAAGLRFGLLLTPPGEGARGQGFIQAMTYRVSSLISSAAAELIETGEAGRIREKAMSHMRCRNDRVRERLGHWGVVSRGAANFFWQPLPPCWNITSFDRACIARGIRLSTGAAYVMPGRPAPNAVRIALGMGLNDAQFDEALMQLDQILASPPTELIA